MSKFWFALIIFVVVISPIKAQTTIYLPVIFKAPVELSAKKGIGAAVGSMACDDMLKVGAVWFQNWQPTAPYNCQNDVRFIPKIARKKHMAQLDQAIINAQVSGWLAGFNEPDMPNQADLTPTEAAQLWHQIEVVAEGIKLVSPTPSQHDPAWMWRFVAEYRRLYGQSPRFNAVGWNIYTKSSVEMQAYLTARHNEMLLAGYDVPIWVMEFGGDCTAGYANNVALIQEMLPWLEAQPWVGRYAWFANRLDYYSTVSGQDWRGCSLVDEASGELSRVGEVYR